MNLTKYRFSGGLLVPSDRDQYEQNRYHYPNNNEGRAD